VRAAKPSLECSDGALASTSTVALLVSSRRGRPILQSDHFVAHRPRIRASHMGLLPGHENNRTTRSHPGLWRAPAGEAVLSELKH
jgi:hypothetical protein